MMSRNPLYLGEVPLVGTHLGQPVLTPYDRSALEPTSCPMGSTLTRVGDRAI